MFSSILLAHFMTNFQYSINIYPDEALQRPRNDQSFDVPTGDKRHSKGHDKHEQVAVAEYAFGAEVASKQATRQLHCPVEPVKRAENHGSLLIVPLKIRLREKLTTCLP